MSQTAAPTNQSSAEHLMTPNPFTVQSDHALDLAGCTLQWKHIRHVPVVNNGGQVVGLVTHREWVLGVAAHYEQKQRNNDHVIQVSEIMQQPAPMVERDCSFDEVVEVMSNKNASCVFVIDSQQKLVGIVTEKDIVEFTAKSLRKDSQTEPQKLRLI